MSRCFEQFARVIDHLRVSAQHHPRMFWRQRHASHPLQLTVFNQGGDPPVEGTRMPLAGTVLINCSLWANSFK